MRTMVVACVLLLASSAWGVEQPKTPVPEPIKKVHARFEQAWNEHDVKALAGIFTEDGDYEEPDGRITRGRKDIERLLGYEHGSVFKKAELSLVVEYVRFPDDDTAIVMGTYELFKAVNPAGKPVGTRTGHFTSVLVKEGGDWKVSAARLMLPQQLIWRDYGE